MAALAATLLGSAALAQPPSAPYANGQHPIAAAPLAVGGAIEPLFLTPPYRVDDPTRWNLPPVPPGYGWVRYWDEAVLVDGAGTVLNALDVRWEENGVASRSGPAIVERIGPNGRPRIAYTDPSQYDRDAFDPRCFAEEDGDAPVIGAVAGAALGAVAGGLVAGSGDGLGGALIGGGLGALAGGVAGDRLTGDRSPVGPCPDDPVVARGWDDPAAYYGRAGDPPPPIRTVPGPVTTTTITFDEPLTTVVEEYGD